MPNKKIDQTTHIYITTKRRRDETIKSTEETGNMKHTAKELVYRKQKVPNNEYRVIYQ
jgi:hypothetical protein